VSEAGIRRSFGVMANYVYDLDDLERNHEAFAREYHVVASRDIDRLARQSMLAARPA
jgi:malonyl-CoA decarboxylase